MAQRLALELHGLEGQGAMSYARTLGLAVYRSFGFSEFSAS